MAFIISFMHFCSHKLCLGHLQWQGNGLYCTRCGEIVAFYTIKDGKVTPYIFGRYRKHSQAVKKIMNEHIGNKLRQGGTHEASRHPDADAANACGLIHVLC